MMKQNIRSFLLLFLCLVSYWATAQNYFFNTNDPQQYVKDVALNLKNSPDHEIAKTSKVFQTYWTGANMTEQQQKMFIHFSKLLVDKQFKPYPHFVDALSIIYYANTKQGVQGADMDTLIFTMYKTIKNYDKKIGMQFIPTLKKFMETRAVYTSNNHNLYIKGGSFKIRFVDENANVLDEDVNIEHENAFQELDLTGEEMADGWGGVAENNDFDDWGDETTTTQKKEEPQKELSSEEEAKLSDLQLSYIEPNPAILKGPIIEFQNVDITFVTKHDSASLRDTKGVLVLDDFVFEGEGGTFDWTMAGLTPEVKGTFKKYKFKVNSPHLTAEGFTLNYPSKISEPVEGIFEFSSKKHTTTGETDYPRFMSYNSNVEIKDLGENIKYHGGFSLRGAKVYSSSVNGGNGSIEVTHHGELKFRSIAKHFVLSDSIITAEPASVVIYQKGDSIYHPGVLLDYHRNKHSLHVYREKSHFKYSTFIDTYHEMDMDVDAIYWNLEDTLMHFTMVNAKQMIPSYFDSKENYQLQKYVQLKGIYPFHALQMIVNYGERKRKKAFYAHELAVEYKQKDEQIQGAMIGLMRRGYIFYNPKTGYIVLRDKAFHYVESRKGKKDFDIISIKSINPGGTSPNATLNLETNKLLIRGVDQVNISDSLGVYFQPEKREVTVLGDRDMEFNGTVFTDVYVFKGKNFKMSYDTFYVNLEDVDSIQFSVLERDTITGEVIGRRKLDNQLTATSGKLWIDKPNNKSGKDKNPQYPYFESTSSAYVYFLKVLKSAYDSTVFYEVPPFKTDSMAANTQAATTFNGTFHSGGIFPPIVEKLQSMEDFSFGFTHKVPEDGYELYKGQGRFYGTLNMDGKGLRGKGEIRYLNTTLYSDDFIFYLDSVTTNGSLMVTKEGPHKDASAEAKYPAVTIKNYKLKWLPKTDSMFVANTTNLVSLYDSTSTFDGKLNVTKNGMLGMGTCQLEGAAIVSKNFFFNQEDFNAHYAEFDILTDIEDKPALRSDAVKIEVDLKEGKAYFSPEEKGKATNEFPYLQYKSSLDDGIWDMKQRIVTMSVPEEQEDISQSYFYSTHPDQDSLVFNARKAVYSMDSLTLHVEGVPFIHVADARIVPGNNELFIGENAQMKKIEKAVITIDTLNQYHRLFDGNIQIVSRSHFEGNATYAYRNIQGDTLPIKFNNFELVKEEISRKKFETHTVATGVVEEADSFLLAPRMMYRGKATMYSNKRLLDLEGGIKIKLRGTVPEPDWLAYENKEDIDEIRIDLDKQNKEEGKEIFTGLHFSSGSRTYYGTFLGKARSVRDNVVFSATGIVRYAEKDDRFDVGPLAKLQGETFEGNVFSYNEKKEEFTFNGKYNLLAKDTEIQEEIQLDFAGFGTNQILDTTFSLVGLCQIDYIMPKEAYTLLGNDIKSMVQGLALPPALNTENLNDSLYSNIANLTDEKTAREYAKLNVRTYTAINSIKKFSTGFVLSHVKLVWSEKEKAWYSEGLIGLASVGASDINAYVKGYLEIKPSRGKNKVTLYIELDENYWYYFSFHKNQLQTLSYQQDFNTLIDAKSEMEKNQFKEAYFSISAQANHPKRFVQQFKELYLNDTLKKEPTTPNVNTFEPVKKTTVNEPQVLEGIPVEEGPAPDATIEVPKKEEKKVEEPKKEEKPKVEEPKKEEKPKESLGDLLNDSPAEPKKEEKKVEEPKKEEQPKVEEPKKVETPKKEEKPKESLGDLLNDLPAEPKKEEKKVEEPKKVETPKKEEKPADEEDFNFDEE